MESFNYNHLFYFWTVARNGSVSRASAELKVSQPTVSEQIGKLEQELGVTLFERAGRGIRLSSTGQMMFGYADQIFRLGDEMREAVQEGAPGTAMRFGLGVAQTVPPQVALKLLAPVLRKEKLYLSCAQEALETLLGRLAVRQIDLVIADSPVHSTANVRAFSNKIAASGMSFVASPKLRLRAKFPQVLEVAPLLVPQANTNLHSALMTWFQHNRVRPRIVGEIEGSGMMETLGRKGIGVFVVPTMVEREITLQLKLRVLGRTTAVKQEFYAITAERNPTNVAAKAILSAKHKQL